jgi:hypothetical protein
MSWTKLSDDFGDHCAGLSDAAFRTHVEALVWTMRRETGGYINARDVRRFGESVHVDMAVTELVNCGWWSIENDGYRVNHHMEHQPEPDVIAARRHLAAERQRRKRRKAAGVTEDKSQRDVTRDNPRDPGRDGSGRDGVTTAVREELDEDACEWCADRGCPQCDPSEVSA